MYAYEFNDWTTEEIWSYIKENDLKWKKHYEKDYYQVFENGLIFSERNNIFLRHTVNERTGYSKVVGELAHRVVLKTYQPLEVYGELQVNHIDGVKLNNHYKNLEWATRKENMAHAVENQMLGQMKAVKLYDINGDYMGSFNSLSDACRYINIDERSLYEILHGHKKHMHGYRVKPIDFEGKVEPLCLSNDYFSGKGVVQLTMKGEYVDEFEKLAYAYKKLGRRDNGTISQVCKGRKSSYTGYKWMYAHEYYNKVVTDSRVQK